MKFFRVQFVSGKEKLIKADTCETLMRDIFLKEAVLRMMDGNIVARLNLEHVECIEEVNIDE